MASSSVYAARQERCARTVASSDPKQVATFLSTMGMTGNRSFGISLQPRGCSVTTCAPWSCCQSQCSLWNETALPSPLLPSSPHPLPSPCPTQKQTWHVHLWGTCRLVLYYVHTIRASLMFYPWHWIRIGVEIEIVFSVQQWSSELTLWYLPWGWWVHFSGCSSRRVQFPQEINMKIPQFFIHTQQQWECSSLYSTPLRMI